MSLIQGVQFEKSQKEIAKALKQCIFNLLLVKPKCVWEVVRSFFQFSKICLHFQLIVYKFKKKPTASQTHFGFINMGSNMRRFSATATSFGLFSNV